MSDLSRRLADRARAAGLVLEDVQLSALERYLELLARWNATINLTALPLDGFPDTTLDRLIGEPLMASRFLPAARSRVDADAGQERLSLFDLGTGGGSPALPLKIIRPDLQLTMVESRDRKSAFLREAIRVLELRDATAMTGRLEAINSVNVDTITVRAVVWNAVLAAAVRRMLAADGRLLLFGSSRSQLAGLELVAEAPLIAPADRLFVMRRSIL